MNMNMYEYEINTSPLRHRQFCKHSVASSVPIRDKILL